MQDFLPGCEKHGISFVGHPAESDDIEEELYFHIPGQDFDYAPCGTGNGRLKGV